MRKIEKELIAAIRAGKSFRSDNTKYEPGKTFSVVVLHGHIIAECHAGVWRFNMCGWPGPTTKSRINAIAREFGLVGLHTSKRRTYQGDKEVPANGWF